MIKNDLYTEPPLRRNHWLAFVILGAGIFACSLLGESWEILADGEQYIKMATGEMVSAPFGYRILIPFLAQTLPSNLISSFHLIALLALTFTGFFLYVFISDIAKSKTNTDLFIIALLFLTSYLVFYYATTKVRVDPLALCILSFLFYGMKQGQNIYWLTFMMVLGVITHESILIFIPILWGMYFLDSELFNKNQYPLRHILFFTGASLLVFAGTRIFIQIESYSGFSYEDGFEIIPYVINHSGGIIEHMQRIYAAFGPIWFLFCVQILFFEKWRSRVFAVFALLMNLLLTVAATDTLRVVSLFFPIIFYYSFKLLWSIKSNFQFGKLGIIALLTLQSYYSFVVFGHLRSFETSTLLFFQAMLSSGLFLAVLSALLLIQFKTEKPSIPQYVDSH